MRRQPILSLYVPWMVIGLLFGPLPAWSEDDIYDRFYDDDTTATMNFFANDGASQVHNLWSPGDADWAKFNADADRLYTIRAGGQASRCNAIIALFHESDLDTPLAVVDDWGPGIADEQLSWPSGSTSGTMFVKVTQSPRTPGLSGDDTTYTLRVTGDWGGNAGLATISGTARRHIGPEGGVLSVPDNPGGAPRPFMNRESLQTWVYTKHQVYFPAIVLDRDYEFIIGAPRDLGNRPTESYTIAWLAEHPGNASIVRILTETPVTLLRPAVLTVQFVDDGPTTYGFAIDDLPEGSDSSAMVIYTWTGSSWRILEGLQRVQGDTVTVPITSLGTVSLPTGSSRMSLFAVAPTDATVNSVKHWSSYR